VFLLWPKRQPPPRGKKAPRRKSPPAKTRRELVLGLGALAVVLCLAYGNIVFAGETLVASANYHPFDYRFDRIRPGTTAGPAFLNWYDVGAVWWQWEPAAQFFRKAYRRATVPLWDPSMAGGVDAHVNLTQGQYFPPYALLLLAGNSPLARDAYTLLLLFGGGACCFLLLRRNGFHALSGIAMGVVFMLAGPLTLNANSIVGQAVAVVPLVVLSVDALLGRPAWPRAALVALAVALCVLASFMPVVISALLLLPFQWLGRVLVREEGDRSIVAEAAGSGVRLAAGVVLGLSLAAFLLIPVHLAGKEDPRFAAWYSNLGLQHYDASVGLTLVSPRITYSVSQVADYRSALFPLPYDWTSTFLYVGLTPLLLVPFAWTDSRTATRRLRLFFAGAGAFVLLKMLGVPPIQWIGKLPVLNQIHFIPYFCGALALCVAGLAGLGVEGLRQGRFSRAPVVACGAIAVAISLLVFRFWSTHAANPAASRQGPLREIARLAVLSLALLVVAWLRSRQRVSGQLVGWLALALVAVELVPLAYRPRFRRHDVWRDVPAFVQDLQSDPTLFRVHGVSDLALTANVFQGLGLSGISSRHAFNAYRYDTLLRHYFGDRGLHFPVAASLLPSRRTILDLLGVKYVVTLSQSGADDTLLRAQGLLPEKRDGDFVTWRNPTVWPRAYVTNRYVLAPDAAHALEATGALTAPSQVVLEEAPPSDPGTPGSESEGTCRIDVYDYGFVRILAESSGPSVLVLMDSLAPGWEARVDSRPVRILAANYAFRGIPIPAGKSVVELRYRPPGLRRGLAVSGVAALILAAILGGGAFSKRSPRPSVTAG